MRRKLDINLFLTLDPLDVYTGVATYPEKGKEMADIIEFKLKAKAKKTTSLNSELDEELGEIVLFSGVRIERDENLDDDLSHEQNIVQWLLNKKIY